jgi:hypothetical protein
MERNHDQSQRDDGQYHTTPTAGNDTADTFHHCHLGIPPSARLIDTVLVAINSSGRRWSGFSQQHTMPSILGNRLSIELFR